MMPAYLEQGLLKRNPFETIDKNGVGELVRIGAERGRATKKGLKLGVCGEHGGDPESIDLFYDAGLDFSEGYFHLLGLRADPPSSRSARPGVSMRVFPRAVLAYVQVGDATGAARAFWREAAPSRRRLGPRCWCWSGLPVAAGPLRRGGACRTWGGVLYIWAGVLYVAQVRQLVRADREGAPTGS